MSTKRSLSIWTMALALLLGIAAPAAAQEGSGGAGDGVTPALQLWEIITGFLLPLVVSTIVQSRWSHRAQAFAAFGVSLAATLVQLFLRGEMDNWTDPTTSFLTVFALTVTFYKGFWKPSGVSPAIEKATNAGPPPPAGVGG